MNVGVNHIGLVTREIRASLAFYARVRVRTPRGGHRAGRAAVRVRPGGAYGTDLPGLHSPQGGHTIALAFLLPTPAAAGHDSKEPWDAFWGQRYVVVEDPSG